MAQALGLRNRVGVLVSQVEPGGPAADAGIRQGDVIREVNRSQVTNVEDFLQKIEQAKSGSSILLLIQRGKNSLFVTVTPRQL
jgi:serine protease Do